MKMSSQERLIKLMKWFFLIGFVLSVVFIAVFPVKSQDITLVVDTYSGSKSVQYRADEINDMEEFTVAFREIETTEIKEIRIYRRYKSICTDKIDVGSFQQYAVLKENSILFNSNMCDILRRNSHSFFIERLVYVQILLAVWLLTCIFLNALSEKFDPNNKNNHGPIYEIGKFVRDIAKYGEYAVYAAKADLKAEVANSYLNRLWWLLEPLFNMLVYVIVFGRLMGNSVENYATFVFSALLMWNYFSKTINYSVKCVRNNRDIVTKVYVPKEILLISNMILNLYKLAFSLIVLIPMLVIFHVQISIHIFWIIPAFLLMILLSFGVGMIFLHYGVYIDDLGYAVGILLQMLMFLSGVFYDVIVSLTTPLNALMLCLNPVSMFIDTMRNALLYNVVSNVPLIALWIIIALLLSYIGIHIVYKNENGYVKVV